MKSAIIAIVIRLQFPPFHWLFQLIYRVAIKASIFSIGRIPGVLAIYLSGSFASKDVIYGLSDIDFKIFVRGHRDSLIYHNIRSRFAFLRRLFPMLGPPDEKGIYFIEDFLADYANYPLIHHLFDKYFYNHELVWGESVIDQLPLKLLQDGEAHLSYIWKLKYWIEKLGTLSNSGYLSKIQERYLFYKAISDISLIYLKLRDPSWSNGRRERILFEMKRYVKPEEEVLITQLLRTKHLYFRKQLVPLDGNYLIFKKIMEYCFELLESLEKGPRVLLEVSCLCEERGLATRWERERERILAVSPPDAVVVTIPWVHIPLSPLDCKYFDCPVHMIVTERPLSLEEVSRLRDFYRSEMIDTAVLMIKDNGHYLYSLNSELMDHWLSSRVSDDGLFNLIAEDSSRTFPSTQLEGIKNRLLAFLTQLEAMMASEDFYRVDRKLYMKVLFTAIRCLVLYQSLLRGKFLLLKSLEEVISFLKQNTPLARSFIERLEEEYLASISLRKPFCEVFFEKTKIFIKTFLELVKNKESLDRLESLNHLEDLQRMSISVVIITRSRCEQLKRCLESMALLERKPDELIVVDNGSNDATREVVQNFQSPFPLHYIYESRVGISRARNAGVKAAKGDVVAFTDDDAMVEPRWLSAIENAFARDPKIGVVGGCILNLQCGRKDLAYQYMDMIARM